MLLVSAYAVAGLEFAAYCLIRNRRQRVGSLLTDWYCLGILLYCAGCLTIMATDASAYRSVLGDASSLCLVGALSGVLIAHLIGWEPRATSNLGEGYLVCDGAITRAATLAIVLTSSLVSAAFIVFAMHSGYSARASLAMSAAGASGLSEFRKQVATGGVGPLGPGIIKQFRDVLLPVGIAAIYLRRPGRVSYWLAIPTVVGITAMLFSGQRIPILVFLLMGIAVYWKSTTDSRSRILIAAAIAAIGVALIIAVTVALGRVAREQSAGRTIMSVLGAIGNRMIVEVPRENMEALPALRFVHTRGGQQLISDLEILLPGHQKSLASSLHAELFGSAAGNSVLGLPADVYANWGLIGAVVAPCVYALLVALFDRRLASTGNSLIEATKLLVAISLPFMYSPYLFLLYGGLFALGLAMLPWPSPHVAPTPSVFAEANP